MASNVDLIANQTPTIASLRIRAAWPATSINQWTRSSTENRQLPVLRALFQWIYPNKAKTRRASEILKPTKKLSVDMTPLKAEALSANNIKVNLGLSHSNLWRVPLRKVWARAAEDLVALKFAINVQIVQGNPSARRTPYGSFTRSLMGRRPQEIGFCN